MDLAVEYIIKHPGCGINEIYNYFIDRKRADTLPIKYTYSKAELSRKMCFDGRVYNKNKGIARRGSEWYPTLDAVSC